jgi:hypothetical protein
MARNDEISLSYRLGVASRVAAAAFGGYALANAVAIFVSRVLPMPRAEAVLAMTLASFAVYTAAIVFAFAARSARAAWLGLLAPSALLAASTWMLERFA